MPWQVLLAVHLLASTIFAIAYRRMAVNLKGFGRIVTAIMYLGVIAPGGIVVALILDNFSFDFSLLSWSLLGLASLLFAAANFMSYQANEELDAAQFAIISNLQALFVIIFAGLFLGERMSPIQLVGALLLIVAAIDVAVEKVGKRTFRLKPSTWVALGSCVAWAAAMTTEKSLLDEIGFATYILIGWSLQSLTIGVLSLRQKKRIKHISSKQLVEILVLGCLRLVAGLAAVGTMTLVDVTIVVSVRSYKPILIFIAALIFLGEKRDLKRRAIGTAFATLGLLLLL